MAEHPVSVAGRRYLVACDDGQEARLDRLAGELDGRVRKVDEGENGLGEAHAILIAALALLDEYDEAKARWSSMTPQDEAAEWAAARLDEMSERLERALRAPG
jgi:cell division protein ZapA